MTLKSNLIRKKCNILFINESDSKENFLFTKKDKISIITFLLFWKPKEKCISGCHLKVFFYHFIVRKIWSIAE